MSYIVPIIISAITVIAVIYLMEQISLYLLRKKIQKAQQDVLILAKELQKKSMIASAQRRFDKAVDITRQQMELVSTTEGPSKSASHPRWKNDIRRQLIEMEREKIDIFKSILADGVDPTVKTISPDNTETVKKMSEIVKEFEQIYNDEVGPSLPVNNKKPKLSIVKNQD